MFRVNLSLTMRILGGMATIEEQRMAITEALEKQEKLTAAPWIDCE